MSLGVTRDILINECGRWHFRVCKCTRCEDTKCCGSKFVAAATIMSCHLHDEGRYQCQ